MDLIPAIDIRGGKCVQLVQGDYARETVYGDDPVAMAQHWASLGAKRLHVVDLDGAREGRPVNDAIVRRIVESAGVPVQVAGGVRDEAAFDRWADAGAHRIVAGTIAVEHPDAVERAARKHGDAIALAVDARDGKAAVKGWLETSDRPVDAFVRDMARRGVRHVIYTDIARDGTLGHPDFEHAQPIIDLVREAMTPSPDEPLPLIYSGGVCSVEDVLTLSAYDLEGVISGTALYDGRIELKLALQALAIGDDW